MLHVCSDPRYIISRRALRRILRQDEPTTKKMVNLLHKQGLLEEERLGRYTYYKITNKGKETKEHLTIALCDIFGKKWFDYVRDENTCELLEDLYESLK